MQFWCELAAVDGQVRAGVLLDVADGRFTGVSSGVAAVPGDAHRLAGLTVPGLANSHSHAFHRALRSRTLADRGSFWTWRELMYRAAERLEPDGYHRLARAVFAEMALAGVTCVGEFHYVHHRPDGRRYADPNEMGRSLLAAAADAGIRITLLDTLYLHGGLTPDGYTPPTGVQSRFSDDSADAWLARVEQLDDGATHRIGAAIHSIRAVDPASMTIVADWSAVHGAPVHSHVSEQAAENEACRTHHGRSPMAVFDETHLLTDRFAAVHATHTDRDDIDRLAAGRSTVVMCPTTERDLGDGIGPTGDFAMGGVPLALGSDSHAVIDLFEEARSVELHERLRTSRRGIHRAADLLAMATTVGHESLGWHDAGRIAVGDRADLVAVSLDSVRTAGATPDAALEAAIFAASAVDVTDVVVDGRTVVSDGRHHSVDVATELAVEIASLFDDD